jgi:azurin
LSKDEKVNEDHWLSKAVYAAAVKHKQGFADAFLKDNPNYSAGVKKVKEREAPNWNDDEWKEIELPQRIENAGINIDGVIWFRKSVEIPAGSVGLKATLSIGPVDDYDIAWVNGVKVGSTSKRNDDRVYELPRGILKPGVNSIAVRVEDLGGSGGIYGEKEKLFIQTGNSKIPLSGAWKYDVEKEYNSKNLIEFKESSIAEVFMDAYVSKLKSVDESTPKAEGNTAVIKIGVIKNEMKYDIKTFTVEAGAPVEIVFENLDFMQHNLVIAQTGALKTIGEAADKLASNPRGAEMHYVPDIPEVLFATKLVDPQKTERLTFMAPEKEGDYPFVCTFPGHWSIMNGVMKVVAKKSL